MDNDSDKSKNDLNPSQQDYREKFEDLAQAENAAAKKSETDTDADVGAIKDQEEAGSGKEGFYRPSGGSSKGDMKFAASLKKRGPMMAIIGLLFGGGMGLTLLFSPGLLIVQMKEVMVSKFNSQLGSMDARTMRILDAKTKQATAGSCSTIKIKCRYASMSDRQIKRFEDAGIKIDKGEKNVFGRYKPKSMTYSGQDIDAKNFRNTMVKDPEFRKAVRIAYNPKFAGFADNVWTNIKTKLGLSKAGPKKVNSVDEMKEQLNKPPNEDTSNKTVNTVDEDSKGACASETCTDEERNKINDENSKAKSTADAIEAEKNIKDVGKLSIGGKITSAVKLTGAVDNACQIYNAVQMTANLAKMIRLAQLSSYALTFLSVADKIKAGNAAPEEVSQLGTILTTNAVDAEGNERKAATDSFGYKYAAYGDVSQMSDYSSLFVVGGGLTGTLSGLTNQISKSLGGRKGAINTCKILANPVVQAGSLIGGIAFAFTGVGLLKIGAQAAIAVAIGKLAEVLPGIAADIIAGNTTKDIQGEDAGDAIASGSSALMGTWANMGGNAPMTKEQALAYNKMNQETAIAYLKDEASDLSPLDASNRYTFMGSIAYNLLPYYSSQNLSIASSITMPLSFLGTAFKNIIPQASALDNEQAKAAMEVCEDYDYKEMGFATDPFCNPMFGIPIEYLDVDPIEVLDYLKQKGYYDSSEDGTDWVPNSEYNKWINQCVNRDVSQPFGADDIMNDETIGESASGEECLIKGNDAKTKAYLYLSIIDDRIEQGMENGYTLSSSPNYNEVPAGEAVSTNLGDFVFPVATSQEKIKNYKPLYWSCWNKNDKTCHDTESSGYYASDIFITPGTPIVAATSGRIVNITSGKYGLSITIKGNDCADGSQTCEGQGSVFYYTHMKPGSQLVSKDQKVTAGTKIALAGSSANTGNGSTEHLHFDVSDRKNPYRQECNRDSGDAAACYSQTGFMNVQQQLYEAFQKLPSQ